MKKLKEIHCKTCKKMFLPKSEHNVFCNRRCFKKNYYARQKAIEKNASIKFPIFKCPSCSRNIELDFDPVIYDRKWLDFKCPFCHILMVCVWDAISTQDTSKV